MGKLGLGDRTQGDLLIDFTKEENLWLRHCEIVYLASRGNLWWLFFPSIM